MSKLVENVLRIDHQYRNKGVSGDLFTLNDLKPADWDYSLPTLTKNDNVFLKKKIKEMKMDEFIKKFKKKFPELNGLDWSNVLIAGGCLGSFLLEQQVNDVDIFLYGFNNQKEADQKLKSICELIVSNLKTALMQAKNKRIREQNEKRGGSFSSQTKLYKLSDFSESSLEIDYIRTKNTLTIKTLKPGSYSSTNCFQIIFRVYQTASEILHGFDLGSSSIGFNGQELYFTTLSKFCYEYNCNIIDTTRRSTTYEHRLKKYFERGFEIIMPNLDMKKCNGRMWKTYNLADVCELPYLVFTYNGVIGNKINFSRWYRDQSKTYISSDYDGDIDATEEYAIYYRNLKYLIDQKYDQIVYLSHKFRPILKKPECFTKARVDYFYDELHTKIQDRQKFPTSMVKNYISVATPEEIFAHREDPEYLENLIKKQKKLMYSRMSDLANYDNNIKWLMDNPGTQLTSSYNPIIEDSQKWYGNYFL